MIQITIDGKTIKAEQGQTIFNIATENGIYIPNLCYDGRMEPYGACGLCVVEVEGIGKLLRACSTVATDAMVVNTNSDRIKACRTAALKLLMSDHEGDCMGPCTLACPAHTDCQGYVKQIALGNDEKAVEIIKEKIPLPASIGRVCPHPCETDCRRGLVEEPISIAYLKAFAADNVIKNGGFLPEKDEPNGKTVGIIGGGPAGLSAAYYLALKGYAVTVYDAMPAMGGMLRYGIPEYRLPKKVLQAEIDEIASLGVEMKNGVRIGEDITLDGIRKAHDAVLVATGAWSSRKLRCKGEELENVFGGIDFLREAALGNSPFTGKRTAIVGGGNTAMDACRTAVRLGAEKVYVIYRRTRNEMPAEALEIEEAIEEGVDFRFLVNPDEILGADGKVCGVRLQHMELGEPDERGRRSPVPVEGSFETLELDSMIIATGQANDNAGLEEIETSRWGTFVASESFTTNLEGVFAVGDAVNKGAGIAIEAIGGAGIAAKAIDAYLTGKEIRLTQPLVSKREVSAEDLADREKAAREKMPVCSPEQRRKDFTQVALGFSEQQARREAARCLECGCFDYGECKLIKYADEYNADPSALAGCKHKCFKEDSLVVIERDQGKCILCGLCVRACDEIAGKGILGLVDRAFGTVIKPEFKCSNIADICKDCLECAQVCPTGALKIIKK